MISKLLQKISNIPIMQKLCQKNLIVIAAVFVLLFLTIRIGNAEEEKLESAVEKNRKCGKQWAVRIEKKGLPNLHQVTDDLYRGAQPDKTGFEELRKMGIKTVVNLRSMHSDLDEAGFTGLALERLYVTSWNPEDEEVVRFLQIVTNKERTPVFVHCQHGADRTGIMVAAYRLAVCGWTKDEAVREMTEGGFGFHKIWQNLVEFVQQMDIEGIKQKAGMLPSAQPESNDKK